MSSRALQYRPDGAAVAPGVNPGRFSVSRTRRSVPAADHQEAGQIVLAGGGPVCGEQALAVEVVAERGVVDVEAVADELVLAPDADPEEQPRALAGLAVVGG